MTVRRSLEATSVKLDTVRAMKTAYMVISLALVLLGCGFMVDSLADWSNYAVVGASGGWAITLTGLLHLLVALGRTTGAVVCRLAVASSAVLLFLLVSGWAFASFASEWPEVGLAVLLAIAAVFAIVRGRSLSR
jgi:hypothetical protein